MKEFYYYGRDHEKKPRVTIVLIEKDGNMARGISIGSYKDVLDKKEGRRIARNRALKAVGTQRASEPVLQDHVRRILGIVNLPFYYKSNWMPALTSFEHKILDSNYKR